MPPFWMDKVHLMFDTIIKIAKRLLADATIYRTSYF